MITLIFSISPSSVPPPCPHPTSAGSASRRWLYCQAGSPHAVGEMDFCHSQAPFLELIILKNVKAHFFPRYLFIKSYGRFLLALLQPHAPQGMHCLGLCVHPYHRRLCTPIALSVPHGPKEVGLPRKELWQKKIIGCYSTYM